MRRIAIAVCLSTLSLAALTGAAGAGRGPRPGADKGAGTVTTLTGKMEKVFYAIGYDLADSFKKLAFGVDTDMLAKGVKDKLSDAKPLISEEEMAEVVAAFREEMLAKQRDLEMQGLRNEEDGKAFLEEHKKKGGVIITPSGLQYIAVREGSGPKPGDKDLVRIHYKGWLIDGTEFANSYTRGEPVTFSVDEGIAGWSEALQLMKTGSVYRLCVPPSLAYDERGDDPPIGPNATLLYDIELLGIEE